MSEVELLPCPVCGRKPQHTMRAASSSERSTTGWMHFAACHDGGYAAHVHAYAYSFAELAAKWNRRTPPPNTAKLLEWARSDNARHEPGPLAELLAAVAAEWP